MLAVRNCMIGTAEHMKLVLEAKVAVLKQRYSAFIIAQRQLYRALLTGAKFVQMWHGIAAKGDQTGMLKRIHPRRWVRVRRRYF